MTTPSGTGPGSPQVSVVLSTWNRCRVVGEAIGSLLDQDEGTPPYEVLLVDNGSTDATRQTVEALVERAAGRLRYLHEPRQGLSHARNTGIRHARAPLVAFTDDDVRVSRAWVATIVRAFREHPGAAYAGGPVLPRWTASPPAWLTRAHWAPLALQDFGPDPFTAGAGRPLCFVGANLAFRARVFEEAGLFSADVQRVGDGIGSTEDHEMLARVWRHGGRGVYLPDLVVTADVPAGRLTRRYHRRWHAGHGRHHARMRLPDMERTRAGRLFGVPAHLYRQAAADAAGWLASALAGRPAQAAEREMRLWFFAGFFTERAAAVISGDAVRPAPSLAARTRSPGSRTDPLVSIVIPCFNQAHFLAGAIRAALAQTHARLDVVVVDDGSEDGASDVAAAFDGVRCLRQPNQGLAAARNAGLAASRGDLVLFTDADDRLLPHAVETGVRALAAHPEWAFVWGFARTIDAAGVAMPTRPQPPVQGDLYAALLRSNCIWMPGTVLYRRPAIEASGGFDPAVNPSADYDLYLRLARTGAAGCHGETVAEYRSHGANMSADAALMLKATLRVHRRQRRHVRGRTALMEAHRKGRRFWQDFYGERLVEEARRAWRRGRRLAAMRRLLVLAVRAPRVLAAQVAKKVRLAFSARPQGTQ